MRRIRTIASLMVCIFVLVGSLSATAQAAGVSLQYINTKTVAIGLSISGDTASCSAVVLGESGTTGISVTMSLERRGSTGSYTTIKTWPTESANGTICSVSKIYAVVSGYTYRVHAEVAVTRNGAVENITEYSLAAAA
jgi:hypothetical protein